MELKVDLQAMWKVWDERCHELLPVQAHISELQERLCSYVRELTIGATASPIVNYSFLLDTGNVSLPLMVVGGQHWRA